MRGATMAAAALLVVTGVCLLEVIGGDASLPYVVGAVIGGACCTGYALVAYWRR